ncbi:hypothetical protein QP157_06035 [Sphingomonas sp. LR61]|uniref:hypothetical protein n=1 Tax=Sphingomonas sp. LR61 TaxID=3050234 RepID=UPI002FE2674A
MAAPRLHHAAGDPTEHLHQPDADDAADAVGLHPHLRDDRGGPGTNSSTLPILAYQEAFKFSQLGFGTAIATILLVVGAVFSIIYIRALKPEVD